MKNAVVLTGACALAMLAAGGVKLELGEEGCEIPKTLYGIFFEDYGYGADGGLNPEMVANGGFDHPKDPLKWWRPDGDTGRYSIQHGRPVHENTSAHLRIESFSDRTPGSVVNTGYYAIAVEQGKEYALSLRARGLDGYAGGVEATLVGGDGAVIARSLFAAGRFPVGKPCDGLDPELPEWGLHTATWRAEATVTNACLRVAATARGTVEVESVSLVPKETFRGHGLRKDLAEALAGLKPAFMRFPGGCMLEGTNFHQWCDWKRTVGPVERRECVDGLWSPIATHRIGYYDYLQFCEDIGCEPLPVFGAGLTCQFRRPAAAPMDGLDFFIGNVLDFIEFATGDKATRWGRVRAEMGHPAPFALHYLQVGNENWDDVFLDRYIAIEKAIKARYPKLHVLSSAGAGVDGPKALPQWRHAFERLGKNGTECLDEHYYRTREWFRKHGRRYDAYPKDGPKVFVGEYACNHKKHTDLECAVHEAAMMTGFERNCDKVVMASYAPIFTRAEHLAEKGTNAWSIHIIRMDALRHVKRAGWHVQRMFAENRPDVLVKSVQTGATNSVFCVAGIDRAKGELVVKCANASTNATPVLLSFGRDLPAAPFTVETLMGAPEDDNTLDEPERVVPKMTRHPFKGGPVHHGNLPPTSLRIYRFKMAAK